MKIIGRILKKSTDISYKRINRRHIDYKNQLIVLRRLLDMAKHTKFGFYHTFSEIIGQSDIVSNYQSLVPINDYEEFHDKWLHKTIEGEKSMSQPSHTIRVWRVIWTWVSIGIGIMRL